MFGKLIGHQLYLSLTQSFAPGWSVNILSFKLGESAHLPRLRTPLAPTQPPFGWSLRPSKGGGWIVPWEEGGWSPFLLRGLGHISEEFIFKKKTLKTVLLLSNLFLTQEQPRPSSTNSISTHSFPGSDWKGAFVWGSFLLASLQFITKSVHSATIIYLKSIHFAPSPLPSLRYHWAI